jgi:hypothetical protein
MLWQETVWEARKKYVATAGIKRGYGRTCPQVTGRRVTWLFYRHTSK